MGRRKRRSIFLNHGKHGNHGELEDQPLDARLRRVTKARLIFGGSCGEGVLMKGTTVSGRYNPASASWGWQAGAESHGCIDVNTPGSAS